MPKRMKNFLVSEREGALTIEQMVLVAFGVGLACAVFAIFWPVIVDKATEIAGWITDAGAH